jgi:hypothetical protein
MEASRRRSITDDYKQQAVDLVASSGRSIGSVAKELGLPGFGAAPLGGTTWGQAGADGGGAAHRAGDVSTHSEEVHIVIIDNLGSHNGKAVRRAIRARRRQAVLLAALQSRPQPNRLCKAQTLLRKAAEPPWKQPGDAAHSARLLHTISLMLGTLERDAMMML